MMLSLWSTVVLTLWNSHFWVWEEGSQGRRKILLSAGELSIQPLLTLWNRDRSYTHRNRTGVCVCVCVYLCESVYDGVSGCLPV